MKKFTSLFLIIVVTIFCFIGCGKPLSEAKTTQNTLTTLEPEVQKTSIEVSTKTKSESSASLKTSKVDAGGGEIVQEKYRQCYYRISYQFAQLVDSQELRTWKEDVFSEDPNDTNEMIMKRFVLDFDISREEFDKANLELAKVLYDPNSPPPSMNPKDYINQEMFELYNADIIYTFDDEIINEYYKSGEYPFVYESDYEDAVASGEYTSQTEEWVDIEQMEAEIIAKYGEIEIETTVEETATVEESTAEITESAEQTTVA